MKVSILSLRGVEYRGEAKSLNVKTKAGEITILDHHRPLITILKPGTAILTTQDGKVLEKEIHSGFLEMNPENQLSLLID